MKNIYFLLLMVPVFLIPGSCKKDNTSECPCKGVNCEIKCPDCYFITDKDSSKWPTGIIGAEYRESDSSLLIYAYNTCSFGNGDEIKFVFKIKDPAPFNIESDLTAMYSFVVGIDAGYFPYEWDSTYAGHHFEIENFDLDNHIIEGQFNVRLKRKSGYTADFKELIYLNNGSFKLCVQ